jgi:hypothetical protein
MSRPSSIDKMEDGIRAEIGRLRMQGCTIDAIIAHLRVLHGDTGTPSRSALGRHIKGLDRIGEKMRQSRQVAEALVAELGDGPQTRAAQLNIELLHGTIMDLFMNAADGEEIDKGGKAALAGNPEGVMMLAKALDHLGKAGKSNIEYILMVEVRAITRAKLAAAQSVDATGKARGLTRDTIEAIKAGIFGVKVLPVSKPSA